MTRAASATRLGRIVLGAMAAVALATAGVIVFPASAEAKSATVGKLQYSISGGYATVLGMVPGSGNGSHLTIPASVKVSGKQYPVTAIHSEAFLGLNLAFDMTHLTIPDSVTTIGARAFEYNETLAHVDLGDGVTTIGASAFEYDDLAGISIPDSVTTIGDGAFARNGWHEWDTGPTLATLHLGDGLVSIGDNAFGVSELSTLRIPDSVTTIGAYAFSQNSLLTSVDLGDGVEDIGTGAFYWDDLGSVSIPDSVTTIGVDAFSANESLASLDLGYGVEDIGSSAFAGGDLTSVTIPDSVTTIGTYAFYRNEITSVSLPGVRPAIDGTAFLGNPLPYSGAASIGGIEFEGIGYAPEAIVMGRSPSSTATDLSIPASVTVGSDTLSVTSIDVDAFADDGLTSVSVPETVTTIGDRAFAGNDGLRTVALLGDAPDVTPAGAHAIGSFGDSHEVVLHVAPTATGYTLPAWEGYATLVAGGSQYVVLFQNADTAGSTGDTAAQVVDRDALTPLSADGWARTGYAFAGWATSANGSVVYADQEPVTNLAASGAAIALHAKWKANTYHVVFKANKGKGKAPKAEAFTYATSKKLSANKFTRHGYKFLGWSTSKSAKKAKYKNKATVKNLTATNGKTITLYAIWKK